MNDFPPLPGVRIELDHIGIATPDLENSVQQLSGLFPSPPTPPEEVSDQHVRLQFIDVGGPRLELLQPTQEESAVGKYLSKKGPGIHHLSFRVEGASIDTWFNHLQENGVKLIGDGPTQGSEGGRIFFVHPKSAGGLLIEFQQSDD